MPSPTLNLQAFENVSFEETQKIIICSLVQLAHSLYYNICSTNKPTDNNNPNSVCPRCGCLRFLSDFGRLPEDCQDRLVLLRLGRTISEALQPLLPKNRVIVHPISRLSHSYTIDVYDFVQRKKVIFSCAVVPSTLKSKSLHSLAEKFIFTVNREHLNSFRSVSQAVKSLNLPFTLENDLILLITLSKSGLDVGILDDCTSFSYLATDEAQNKIRQWLLNNSV